MRSESHSRVITSGQPSISVASRATRNGEARWQSDRIEHQRDYRPGTRFQAVLLRQQVDNTSSPLQLRYAGGEYWQGAFALFHGPLQFADAWRAEGKIQFRDDAYVCGL